MREEGDGAFGRVFVCSTTRLVRFPWSGFRVLGRAWMDAASVSPLRVGEVFTGKSKGPRCTRERGCMAKIYDFDIGILGGGAAGLTVAAGASQLGAKTLLIEKEKTLGGDCLHFGCVPSKSLIRTARLYHEMKHAEKYGLPNVEVPPVDYRAVANRIHSVIARIQLHDSEERFCRLGTLVQFGEAEFVDEHSVRLNGKTVSARTWVLATGSSPAVPPNGRPEPDPRF